MAVDATAPAPRHTCVRLRAPTMRPLLSRAHAHACVHPPVYIANAHVNVQYIYIYLHRCKVGACEWVRVRVLAYACDRVRALPMRSYAACVRVRYTDERIADAGPPHTRARLLRPCARARVRVRLGAHASAPTHASAFRRWLGAQAFQQASAFNANIGAWNTARVLTLEGVCAAVSAAAARHRRRHALGGSSMRRGPLCAAAPPMRARVCAQTCGHSHARMSPCVGIAARSKDGMYV
jgi:hypothetical protein